MNTDSKIIEIARNVLRTPLSNSAIARNLHVSPHLVSKVRAVINEKDYSLEDIEEMDTARRLIEFRREDYSESVNPRGRNTEYSMPDCEYFAAEAVKYKLTYSLMYDEYYDSCIAAGTLPYKLTQFKKYLGEYIKKQEFSEVMVHHPGDEMEVDWVGDKAFWIDPDTGEIQYGWMFVGCLSFSGKAYVEVFEDMKEQSWITAHVHMFEYFGGVTRVLVCDNLKTGVLRHPRDSEAQLQKDYAALGNYYGIAIVPARVLAPNDKPLAENTVRFVEDYIIKKLRHAQCFSLEEYNRLVIAELEKLNNRPFQKKDGSRNSAYINYEQSQLLSLPLLPFRYCEKKLASVQRNCCVSLRNNFYSVPYKKVKPGSKVWLHIYENTVEIWNESSTEKLCEHKLVSSGMKNVYQIVSEHMPPKSYRFSEWNSDRFRRWARSIGPETYELIDDLFINPPEQKYYSRAHAILNLETKYGRERLETAVRLARLKYRRPASPQIRALLENAADLEYKKKLQVAPDRSGEKSYIRGAEYYAEKERSE